MSAGTNNQRSNVNCKDEARNTPMNRMFLGNPKAMVEVAKMLLEADADSHSFNVAGKTAIHCALDSLSVEECMHGFDTSAPK
jgi:ankyrin repeat protein